MQKKLDQLAVLVGQWETEMTHPQLPGAVVRGTVDVEWLEGEQFLLHRARTDHPDFPDSISIVGFTDRDRLAGGPEPERSLTMHYYDSRGVFRLYDVDIDERAWHIQRLAPGFSQRFTGTFAEGGTQIVGRWQASRDDVAWEDDLAITYRRVR